jgi:hypothetical protein
MIHLSDMKVEESEVIFPIPPPPSKMSKQGQLCYEFTLEFDGRTNQIIVAFISLLLLFSYNL